jgi:hypothetical protein
MRGTGHPTGSWSRRRLALAGSLTIVFAIAMTSSASAGTPCTAPGENFTITSKGKACSPSSAPQRVKDAVQAANEIRNYSYKWGGGHGSWYDNGYDCSGAVSYALGKPGGNWISWPYNSGGFMSWGTVGSGSIWLKVYANSGHVWMKVKNPNGSDNGIRWDTSDAGGSAVEGSGPSSGPDWHNGMNSSSGYALRRPKSFNY